MQALSKKRMEYGIAFAENIWYRVAQRIFNLAAQLYGWEKSRRDEMEEIFLRPNDYHIEVIVDST